MKKNKPYRQLLDRLREIRRYGAIASVLQWDQETVMPPGGGQARAELFATLAGRVHELATARELGALLADAAPRDVVVRETERGYRKAQKIPNELAMEAARVASVSHQVWVKARERSDFKFVRPHLEKIVKIQRRVCDLIGFDAHPYDVLLDGYEPHATTAEVDAVFSRIREPLIALAGDVSRPPLKSRVIAHDHDKVRDFCREILARMGYNFEHGQIGEAAHPFSLMIHATDVRVTIRREEGPVEVIQSAMHEGGHALYSQGLDPKHWGTPLGEAESLSIHESQSRIWENQVGRSRAFWKYFLPRLRRFVPGLPPLDDFLTRINHVSRTPIRVASDEVTYGLHIMLRFELEKALIAGELAVRDIPGAWNDGMKKYLGFTPKNDAQGCLQDVHWYGGAFGYFPTYLLGNLYAAQFHHAYGSARLDAELRRGNLLGLSHWLKTNVHRRGSRYPARKLVQVVTGEKLNPRYFLEYLDRRYR